jgi:hypothetical protein
MNTESEEIKQTTAPVGEPAAVETSGTGSPKKRGLNLPNQLTMFRMLPGSAYGCRVFRLTIG